MEITIYVIIGLFIYFIPSIIGWNSKKASGIIVLNLFLGWTILGWVGALIWAVTAQKEDKKHYYNKDNNTLRSRLIAVKDFIFMQTETKADSDDEFYQLHITLKQGEAIIKNKLTEDYKIVTAEQWEKILTDNKQNNYEIIEEK